MRRPARLPPQRLRRVFAAPLILMATSLTGLILGLTGDGWRDLLAITLLILPIAVFTEMWRRRGQVLPETTSKKKVHP